MTCALVLLERRVNVAVSTGDRAAADALAWVYDSLGYPGAARVTRQRAGLLKHDAAPKAPRKTYVPVPAEVRRQQVLDAIVAAGPAGIQTRKIAHDLGLTQSHVSRYIHFLEADGLVKWRRTGRLWVAA